MMNNTKKCHNKHKRKYSELKNIPKIDKECNTDQCTAHYDDILKNTTCFENTKYRTISSIKKKNIFNNSKNMENMIGTVVDETNKVSDHNNVYVSHTQNIAITSKNNKRGKKTNTLIIDLLEKFIQSYDDFN